MKRMLGDRGALDGRAFGAPPVFVLQRVTDVLVRNSPSMPHKRLPLAVNESF